MAVTVVPTQVIDRQRVGRHMETTTRLVLTSTYVTGGVPIAPSVLGLSRIDAVVSVTPSGTQTTQLEGQWDPVNQKLVLIETGAAVDGPFKEVSSAQSVSTTQLDVVARGLG